MQTDKTYMFLSILTFIAYAAAAALAYLFYDSYLQPQMIDDSRVFSQHGHAVEYRLPQV